MARKSYKPISLGEFIDGSEEWMGARAHGKYYKEPLHPEYIPVTVTGSEASCIENDNTFKSKEELYAEKVGIDVVIKKPKNQAILDAGHELEQYVANMFKKYMLIEEGITDIEVWQDTNMYQHPLYPFALANVDRRIKVNGVEGLLECKTTGNFSDIESWKQGIVPKKYEWQVRHYLGVLNLPYAYIVCCWGFTLKEMAVIKITRDLAVEQMLFEDEAEFVEICELGEEFVNTGSKNAKQLADFYLRLYGTVIGNDYAPVEFPHTEEIEELMLSAQTLFERKKNLEKQLQILEEENFAISAQILKLAEGKTNYATYRIDDDKIMRMKLHIPTTRKGFDKDALKNADPETYKNYCTLFDESRYKKENKAEAKKYEIPPQVKPEAPYLKEIKVENMPLQ